MRVDQTDSVLFKDKRVRQAIALTLNRPQIIKTLFNGNADLGNDSPFAPVYPSTVEASPQRHKDICRRPSELIAAAGLKKGWKMKLVTYQTAELPQPRADRQAGASSRSAATSTSRSSPAPSTTRAPRRRRRGSTSR